MNLSMVYAKPQPNISPASPLGLPGSHTFHPACLLRHWGTVIIGNVGSEARGSCGPLGPALKCGGGGWVKIKPISIPMIRGA